MRGTPMAALRQTGSSKRNKRKMKKKKGKLGAKVGGWLWRGL
ncbi:hypothetical protein TIFTF001_054358 [Ficus carica]|uniref:Uncharacterized protein n=1 Tax=Ficus carica TaxID=3494 RepID=A0AA88EF54_FICCA|nr:hypothetical protein TIFTF001_054358 [Ficus carica]